MVGSSNPLPQESNSMIFDSSLIFCGTVSPANALVGQLITANSTLSINTVDLGPPMLNAVPGQLGDIGSGEPLDIHISILAAPTTATAVQFQLIQADDAALTSNVQVINQTDAFPIASLPTGARVVMSFDTVVPYAPRRYIGMRVVSTGATVAGLSVFAAATKNVQSVRSVFKGGYGIS